MLLAVALAPPARAGDCCAPSADHPCCAQLPRSAAPLSDKSIYQLDALWTNDLGATVTLTSLKGRPQVVTMFFAHCQYACPLLVYKMKQIEAALPENLRTNVGFTLVSFDADRDTPEALRAYRAQHHLGPEWTLLHGNSDEVLNLAALLGVQFKRDAQGQFAHSNLITVLNANGELAYQEPGLNLDTGELIHHLQNLNRPERRL